MLLLVHFHSFHIMEFSYWFINEEVPQAKDLVDQYQSLWLTILSQIKFYHYQGHHNFLSPQHCHHDDNLKP